MPNYFLAAHLPKSLCDEVKQYRLINCPSVRATTPPANMHITVGYIGGIASEDLDLVADSFQAVIGAGEVDLNVQELMLLGRESCLCVGVGDPTGMLEKLKSIALECLEKATEKYTFYPRERFLPHITLQRLKKPATDRVKESFLKQSIRPYPFKIETLGLWYKNQETGLYETYRTYSLKS